MHPLASRPDLTAQTHEAIRDAIMSGDLAPGAPLAQEDLAERLGVSRQPVSHALVLLRREGLVVDRGRKGQMVAPIEADRVLALYQVRGAMDGLAARLAALRAPGDDTVGSRLQDLLDRGEAACETGEINRMVDADLAFHQALHDASGNHEIARTSDSVWPHMVRSMRMVLQNRDGWPAIWAEHAAIAEAVVSGDPEQAGLLATRHAEQAGEATFQRLGKT